MTVVAGIDEAGLGPLLGPLVVAATAFELPPELAGASLWDVLGAAVAARPERRGTRMCIADSKTLYHGRASSGGLARLERGVLAALAASGVRPASLRELLSEVAPGAAAALDAIPWYRADLPLPVALARGDVDPLGERLARAMAATGVRLVEVRAEPVLEAELNDLLAALDNKLDVLFAVGARLLGRLRERGDGCLVVHHDRHGGRMRYLPGLSGVLGEAWIWTLHEDARSSAYRVVEGGRRLDLDFTVGAESLHLPVALASMLAKYVRELLMRLLNGYWCGVVPGLFPTAGYQPDGGRFLAEVRPALRRLALTDAALARAR